MERIKQALEKARLNRDGQPGKISPQQQEPSHGPGDSYEYFKTRTFDVPRKVLLENHIITENLSDSFNDSFKILRTQILHRMIENNWKSLAITSSGESEGKTLTSINLAVSLAMELSHTVLLVDANLRNPGLHKCFGLQNSKGLSDYLLDNEPLDELLLHPSFIEHLVILPSGRALLNSAEMLNSPKMVKFVDEVAKRYPDRVIIYDLPSTLSSADMITFAPNADAILLVVAEGKTKAQDLAQTLELLQNHNVIGTVLNCSDGA